MLHRNIRNEHEVLTVKVYLTQFRERTHSHFNSVFTLFTRNLLEFDHISTIFELVIVSTKKFRAIKVFEGRISKFISNKSIISRTFTVLPCCSNLINKVPVICLTVDFVVIEVVFKRNFRSFVDFGEWFFFRYFSRASIDILEYHLNSVTMSDLETQARIVHRSNKVREELKSLFEWEKDMKQMEAKRAAVSDEQVGAMGHFHV